MTKTDRIKDAIAEALGKRKAEIDGDDDLVAITLVIKLAPGGRPKVVNYRPESVSVLPQSR